MTRAKIKLIYAEECYRIMGIIFDVFSSCGFGHREILYQKAIAEAFRENGIEFKEQLRAKIKFKEKEIGLYILDFLVFGKIIIELKQKNFFARKDI